MGSLAALHTRTHGWKKHTRRRVQLWCCSSPSGASHILQACKIQQQDSLHAVEPLKDVYPRPPWTAVLPLGVGAGGVGHHCLRQQQLQLRAHAAASQSPNSSQIQDECDKQHGLQSTPKVGAEAAGQQVQQQAGKPGAVPSLSCPQDPGPKSVCSRRTPHSQHPNCARIHGDSMEQQALQLEPHTSLPNTNKDRDSHLDLYVHDWTCGSHTHRSPHTGC